MKATAARNGRPTSASSVMHARASAGDSEYFDAAMRSSLLNRIAEETGGRFFTPANAASLPEAISYSGRGVTVVEERDLWDMPIILMLLLALIGAEWGYPPSAGAGVKPLRDVVRTFGRSAAWLRCCCSAVFASRHRPSPRTRTCSSSPASAATRSTSSSSTSTRCAIVDAAKKHGCADANIAYLGENPEQSGGG